MFRDPAHLAPRTNSLRQPVRTFIAAVCVMGVALSVFAVLMLGSAGVALMAFGLAATLAGFGLVRGYEHAQLGACNIVTLARAGMVAFLVGALVAGDVSPWVVFGVAVSAFALDGVDGWMARRARMTSEFGARFDMEVDAALGAVISLWILTQGIAGPQILVLGFMRYAFVGASVVWPALRAPLPQAFRRKVICVVQIGALILLMLPLTPQALVLPVGLGAALLLSWSFLVDILWLVRHAG